MRAPLQASRRSFLRSAGGGAGMLALAGLFADEQVSGATNPLASREPDFAPRAKRIVWLFMHGGPSQVDLLDPKPDLAKFAGKPLPESFGQVMTRRDVAKNP